MVTATPVAFLVRLLSVKLTIMLHAVKKSDYVKCTTPCKTKPYKPPLFSPRSTRSNRRLFGARTAFSPPNRTAALACKRRRNSTVNVGLGTDKRKKVESEKVPKESIKLNKSVDVAKKAAASIGSCGKVATKISHTTKHNDSRTDAAEDRCKNVPVARSRCLKYLPGSRAALSEQCKRQEETVAVAAEAKKSTVSKTGGSKNKGPPAKGLEILREARKRKRAGEDLSDVEDSDSDYQPSSEEESSGDTYSSSELEHDDPVETIDKDTSRTSLNAESVWSNVKARDQTFTCNTVRPTIADFVPNSASDVIEFFQLFLTDEILEIIVTETNRNGKQNLQDQMTSPRSRLAAWKDTNVDEMKRFIGILLWMGLMKLPSISSYWSRDCLYRNGIASTTMTRNRFQLLLRMWHFADNHDEQAANDRLHKIRHVLNLFVANFASARQPGEDLVVDETMVPFRGRLKFKQYIPAKTHKYGIKLFKVCDSVGYTYNVKVYTGKEDRHGVDLATDVVLQLISGYLDAGRILYTDNFYTSIPLAQELLKRKTHLVGTVRKNRKMLPTDVAVARLKVGESIARQNSDGIVVQKWRDRRDVLMMSTKHDDSMMTVSRRNGTVEKPAMVVDYNQNKQGIDVSDQLASYHSCLRKTVRWYHKVMIEVLLGTSVVNAMILYNEQRRPDGKKPVSITEFRELLCKAMVLQGITGRRESLPQRN